MNINCEFVRISMLVLVLGVVGGATACTSDPDDPGADAGTGGADAGMGSMGGAGGMVPAGAKCASSLPVPAANPTITDFDSYDGSPIGMWTSSLGGDVTSGVTVGVFGYGDRPSGLPETYEMAAGHESTYAMRIADTLAQVYGGGMGTWLSACLNASSFKGLSFWVRGNSPLGKVTLTLAIQETQPSTPAKAGDPIGTCAGTGTACVHPTFPVTVTNTWTKVQVAWTDFTAGSAAGTSVSPNGRNIIQMQFGVDLNYVPGDGGVYMPVPAPYELAVDTLAFY